jgi:hypothetical protein
MSDQKPRKWRLRMTVRALMVVILILSMGIGLPVRRAKRQEAAIAKVTRLGGIVGYDYNYWVERGNYPPWPSRDPPAPRWLRLGGLIGGSVPQVGPFGRGRRPIWPNENPPPPPWLLNLLGPEYFRRANFVSLAELQQKRRAIPDLAFLEDLPDVQVLHLDSTNFVGSELSHVRPLKLIRFLASDSNLDDDGLAHLARQAELWEICLSGTRVTDRGLTYLAGLPKLRFVDLSRLRVTDAGLAPLSHLPNLERLTLAKTPIGDDGLANLAGLVHLKILQLEGTQVTDAGLVHLRTMPGLQGVVLPKSGVTDGGVAELQRAMPGLKFVRR